MHQAVAGVVVGDARGVPQQILDRHRPLQRDQFELAVVLDADLLVGEFRNEFGDRIVQQEVAFLEQHHDADRDDRFSHREDAEDACCAPSASEAAGLCRPSASNQPIWPRRATITVAPGRVPLSISRLNASDMRCSRTDDSPSDSGLACGQRRRLRGRGVFGGGLRGHGLSHLLLSLAVAVGRWNSGAERRGLNRVFPVNTLGVTPLRPCNRGVPYA